MQDRSVSPGGLPEMTVGSSSDRTLLLVDDEPRVSRGLQRILRQDGYCIRVASDPYEALSILTRHQVDVILADQRMPGMKGTEFLSQVSELYPETLRLILSGAADIDEIAQAMGSGVIYKFLTKPIDPALLRANVSEAFSRSESDKVMRVQRSTMETESGLPARKAVAGVFEKLLASRRAGKEHLVVLVLRVDQLDGIVSSYGRSFSEQVQLDLSRRLARILDQGDVLGLDAPGTFLMVLATSDPADRVTELDNEIDRMLDSPIQVDGQSLTVTLSIGAAVQEGVASFDKLVDQAHTAMMTGQERGGATIQLFQPHLIEAFRGQLELESELRCAVAEKKFILHYQPQVDVTSGEIIGLETLVRWQHPKLGFVSPARFIPLAERSGLIETLGLWILKEAVSQFSTWESLGKAPRELAINVSARQLRTAEFADRVAEVLDQSGLDPSRLVLEITESAAIEENEAISACLKALHALGVVLAVDDFGTGYANLGNLTRFSFTQLKLDRSLLPENPKDERRMSLYRRVCGLAEELRMSTIAEGVETTEELAAVVASGCHIVQGYFYSAPVPASKLDDLLASRLVAETD